jgi:Flp pilus assembly protein TadD
MGSTHLVRGQLDQAITEYRTALRLKPNLAAVRTNLGMVLRNQGRLAEAVAELREALRLSPDDYVTHLNLGAVLNEQGKQEEAIAEHREALRLRPDHFGPHFNLGNTLRNLGKLEEAIAEYRAALRLEAGYPQAHQNLGVALRARGEFSEASAELRKAHDLARKSNPRLAEEVERELIATEREAWLVAKVPDILARRLNPRDGAETLCFAQLCYDKKLHGASARLWSEAFRAEPKLADDMKAGNRYNAACAAALAGSAQGQDKPPLDEATKARWRKQALDWLKADLAAWSKLLQTGPLQARQTIVKNLQHWKADPDLAGVRDPEVLTRLPEAEQQACRVLWAEVDALLAKAQVSYKR